MRNKIAVWATVGFLIACCWVAYTFLVSPDILLASLRNSAVQALQLLSFPLSFLFRRFPIHFWWVPLINAATYAVIGLIFELLRSRPNPSQAV